MRGIKSEEFEEKSSSSSSLAARQSSDPSIFSIYFSGISIISALSHDLRNVKINASMIRNYQYSITEAQSARKGVS